MADSFAASKLKRKRSSADKNQVDAASRGNQYKSRPTPNSEGPATSRRPADPAAVWWSGEQLPVLEGMWALMLKSAQSYLDHHLVPDLPQPSAAKPTALKLDEQRWCDLREEVPSLPEPCPPSDPPSTSSSLQDFVIQVKPAAASSDMQLVSDSARSNVGINAGPGVSRGVQPSVHSWEDAAASDRPVPLHQGGVHKAEVVGEVEDKKPHSVGGDGGVLPSCPMCLLVFPAGFTQMDCDGHLAQCLSEVNVDVTW
ncbi:uncharacterized protein V6R79_000833 [Siganus canaliculatus]